MIVLDTHALLWWVNNDAALSAAARRSIDDERRSAGGQILVSAISVWEIAMLVQAGRLGLLQPVQQWTQDVTEIPGLAVVPVDSAIAIQSVHLPGQFHKDPADRIIVATAQRYGAALVTADAKIHAYPHVRIIW